MKQRTLKWVIGIGASVSLGLAASAVSAHPGLEGVGMNPDVQGSPHQFPKGGVEPGAMRHRGMAAQAAQHLKRPEERTVLQEKMRSAHTSEERLQIATASRAEIEKRIKDKGITLPEHHGRHGNCANTTAPATSEHVH